MKLREKHATKPVVDGVELPVKLCWLGIKLFTIIEKSMESASSVGKVLVRSCPPW